MTSPTFTGDLFEYSQRLAFHDMTRHDMSDLQEACHRVYRLMQDGEWHNAQEIIDASQQREGIKRLRELRGIGFKIEKRRLEGRREWQYRVSDPDEVKS